MTFRLLIFLASWALAATTAASSNEPRVDLFPSQSWNSLRMTLTAQDGGLPAQPDSADLPPTVTAETKAETALPSPFQAVGVWVEAGQRVAVLERQGQTFLLCQRCRIGTALRPGALLMDGYQFKELAPKSAVLLDPQGRKLNIDLALPAQ